MPAAKTTNGARMIVSIVNIKGGCGKTTSAIALASAAARAGHEAVVYDADPQGSASEWALVAEDLGNPLPFPVSPINIAAVRRLKPDGRLVFIDCPPSGTVTDEAIAVADFVIVPSSPSPADLSKTWVTVGVLDAAGRQHAILLTKTMQNTVSFKSALEEIEENGYGCFKTVIPKREAVGNLFGQAFDDLFGYDRVLDEMMEVIS